MAIDVRRQVREAAAERVAGGYSAEGVEWVEAFLTAREAAELRAFAQHHRCELADAAGEMVRIAMEICLAAYRESA